jgi:hypothetical protein
VSARQNAVKKYVVTLSAEERERLQILIRSGKHPARKLMRARILLKADVSEAGDAWSDSQIAEGLETSLVTVARIRQRLVEEGVDGVLTPKRSPNSARKRIFDGASEAKLIALACSQPPEGYARWTLQMLEGKAVELNIVARASDNTIGRTLKNILSAPGEAGVVQPVRVRRGEGSRAPPCSECCVVVGDGGREAYTAIRCGRTGAASPAGADRSGGRG